MHRRPTIPGAPLFAWAPLWLLLLAPLAAQSPALARAQESLRDGSPQAAAHAVAALRANPLGAPENLHTALMLFHAGRFEDSARHLRRAVAADPQLLARPEPLATRMPPADIPRRLRELGPLAETNPEVTFLAGALLLMAGEATAQPMLIRAEELAGTDGQAAMLGAHAAGIAPVMRSVQRARAALRAGKFEDAARGYAFAVLDVPTDAASFAAMALALELSADTPRALRTLQLMPATPHASLFEAMHALQAPAADCWARTTAMREITTETPLPQIHLAALAALAGGLHATVRSAALHGMRADKLDIFSHELMQFMDARKLDGDPPGLAPDEAQPAPPEPEAPQPAPEPTPEQALENARRLIRRLEFSDALKLLEPQVQNGAPEVLLLVFIACVGRAEINTAADALQAWYARVDDATRARLNLLREKFDRAEHFNQWRSQAAAWREADPNAPLPRLIHGFIEFTRGAYTAARADVQVALIGAPANPMLQSLNALLAREEFARDAGAPPVADRPTARALIGLADTMFRRGEYEAARRELLKAHETNPNEPLLGEFMVRAHFATGDYERAARYLEQLLEHQKVAEAGADAFQFSVAVGYGRPEDLATHLQALRTAAAERTAAADEYLLLGAIHYSERRFTEARDALAEWQGLSRDRKLNPAVLKLLEQARKRAE